MNEVDCAWVAGLLEGEGAFYLRTNRPISKLGRSYGPYSYPTVAVCMTDRDVLDRLCEKTGTGAVTGPRERPLRPEEKPVFYWTVTRTVEALALMLEVLPHMCERRAAQIRVLLDRFDPESLTD